MSQQEHYAVFEHTFSHLRFWVFHVCHVFTNFVVNTLLVITLYIAIHSTFVCDAKICIIWYIAMQSTKQLTWIITSLLFLNEYYPFCHYLSSSLSSLSTLTIISALKTILAFAIASNHGVKHIVSAFYLVKQVGVNIYEVRLKRAEERRKQREKCSNVQWHNLSTRRRAYIII